MDLASIEQIAFEGESEQVELKKSTADLTGACESLCGMINAGVHGFVLIGIANGKIVGQEVTDKTQQEIARAIREFTPDPRIHFSMIPFVGQRKVIILSAKGAPEHLPYFFRGKAYLRVGTTTSTLSRDRVNRFFKISNDDCIPLTHSSQASTIWMISIPNGSCER